MQHLTIMRIMTQLNMDKDKNNIEYKNCLKCGVVINKTDGCNHMKCVCGFELIRHIVVEIIPGKKDY